MALSRVTVWVAGQVLTAAALNGEFNNLINNPISLLSPTTGAINFNLQAHSNLIPGAISATSGTAGQVLAVSGASAVWQTVGAAVGSRVSGFRSNISSQSGTFTADQYLLQTTNASNSFVLESTSAFAINVGTAGPAAGGRDIAGAFASTYVHWYAITTGANSTTLAGIVSTATPPAGPVMPTSYSAWCYLGGSVYTSSSTTVAQDHFMRGNKAYLNTPAAVLVSGTATVETAVSISSAVPSNALSYSVRGRVNPAGAGGNCDIQLFLRYVSGNDAYSPRFGIYGGLSGVNQVFAWPLGPLANTSSQQFLYLHAVTTGTIGNGTSIDVTSYEMPNGDA